MPLARAFLFHWRLVLTLGALMALAPVGWYLGSPLFVTRTVSEALPASSIQLGRQPVETALPKRLASGSFGVIDGIHRGQGSANVLRLTDGSQVLRLEDFMVTNGPDLYVYFSPHPAPRSSAELHEGGAFEVAPLKGNVGDQNYPLPAELNVEHFASAVVYCRRFAVVFSTAELRPGGGEQ
jgi:hypothetical protein